MLIERNQFLIGLIAAAVVAAGTVFAVIGTAGGFVGGITLSATFTDAAALESGNFVFVAGVRAGRVKAVEIEGDHVVVDFALQAEGVPNDSTVAIILQNTLGKRAIKVYPGESPEPFRDGDTIPIQRTSTPVDFPELGDETVELLAESNVDALDALTTALADITEGQRDEVGELLDGVERLTKVIADRKDDLARVIRRSEVFVDALADKDQELVGIIDDFGSTLSRLAARRADILRLLGGTARSTGLAADLLESRRAQLDRILFELHEDLQIVDRHQVDIAHVFAYAGVAVEGFAGIGYMHGDAYDDTPAWGNVFTTGVGQLGIDAALGCGGTFDQILTELIGPDPDCDGPEETVPTPAAAAATTPSRAAGIAAFFTLGHHHAEGHR
ncbi:MAG TPA: MCE family protein [Nitriliruptorales bacterium]